ncbi:MAG: glycoside hydrolase family 3 N-terminal domain-containing protein [Spirochaetota bacterium]
MALPRVPGTGLSWRVPRFKSLPWLLIFGFFALALIWTSSPPPLPWASGAQPVSLIGMSPLDRQGGILAARDSFASGAAATGDFWTAGPVSARVEAILASMGDEEVLGQVFLLTWPGQTPTPTLYRWIRERGIGGIKIFGWNAENTANLAAAIAGVQTAALGSLHRIPLLVATDQEGGIIRHVKGATSETPGNMAIGASGLPSDAYWSGFWIARELDALGITMNFAPTIDLETSPKSPLIGVRAFCSDPRTAGLLGASYAAGTIAAGLIPTAKHFPGHGATELDSHGILPRINIDEEGLWNRELVPYRVLADEGLPAIMSAHLSFPKIEPSGVPASLSHHFMTDILRTRLGFKGVAVTDDLRMKALGKDFGANCRAALEAGNDLLVSSELPALDDPAWTSLLSAYRKEPAFRQRVWEAASRVLTLKLQWLAPRGRSGLVPDLSALASRLPDPESQAFFREQAKRSATALDQAFLPWTAKGRLLIASPLRAFSSAAAAAWPVSRDFHYSWRIEGPAIPSELAAFGEAIASADSVLVCVPNQAGMDFALLALKRNKRVAVLSLLSPLPLERAPLGLPAVAVYSTSPESIGAGIAALRGEIPASGRFPFLIKGAR